MIFLRILGQDHEAGSVLNVAGPGELADVLQGVGERDVFETEATDGGFRELPIVSCNFDFGVTSGAKRQEGQGLGERGVEKADFTENDPVHRPLVHGHFAGILGGSDDLVDDIVTGLSVSDDERLRGWEVGRYRPLGKGNAKGFEELGDLNFLNLSGRRGDEVKEVDWGGPESLDDLFPGRSLLFVGRIWADYDCEFVDLVNCFGLKADGAEGFGESGFGEVEIFDDGLVRVGVGEDKVDALRRVGAIELD